tara:strand:+ start:1070 stop:1249 length:180 start_codon:yes stop_codon:yes gene_type:complete
MGWVLVYSINVPKGEIMNLELTNEEFTTLYEILDFVLDGLDEDDDRYESTQSVMNKLGE